MDLACSNQEKILLTAAPDGEIQGNLATLSTVVSGDGTIEPGDDNLSCWLVSGEADGVTVFQINADADMSAGEVLIGETINLTVTAAMATNLGLTAGTPVPK